MSCQAMPDDPLEDDGVLRRISQAVVAAGAEALRLNGASLIGAVREDTSIPIIGIEKRYQGTSLRITPTFQDAVALAQAGADIIALDCTDRVHPFGEPWRQMVERIHGELGVLVMADIATLEEGIAAAEAGVDLIGPTLNGYTEATKNSAGFDWKLLRDLQTKTGRPVIAEGRINTPEDARRAIEEGAWSVVVGSAITRPGTITREFIKAVSAAKKEGSARYAIGVDIGGTTIKAAVVSEDGSILSPIRLATDASLGREGIAANLKVAISQSLANAKASELPIEGIGIATAGAVDHRDGSIFAATENLPGWTGFPLRTFAEDCFHLPCFVINDAHAAVLSEQHFGFGDGLRDFVAITIGTGIGGGIVSNGKLLLGQHGFAGTLGHSVIQANGRPCNCGRAGCLEAYVSTAGLIREYSRLSGFIPEDDIDDAAMALKINQLACRGDEAAQEAYKVLSLYLSDAIANLFNILDPQVVLLSGGLIESYPQFIADVESQVHQSLHFGEKRCPQVRAASAGKNAGIQGAATLVFEANKY
ncbi:MAG: putative N-acetylmannosamine-6-phosphate 2-epimerase [Acidobacteria bacterium]|nr:putative N-acetylmannosamine-6-phosphate 2-epimerase [Acidobacteriota bacterium]